MKVPIGLFHTFITLLQKAKEAALERGRLLCVGWVVEKHCGFSYNVPMEVCMGKYEI